jgi:hypothetical protein
MVGLSEEEFTVWTRLELAPLGAEVQCPRHATSLALSNISKPSLIVPHPTRCRTSFLVSREDYQTADTPITCPVRRCRSTWCKGCAHLNPPADHVCRTSSPVNTKGKQKALWFKTLFSKYKVDDDGTKQFEKLMKASRWKRCPGCRTPISRTTGCDHMTCTTPGCRVYVRLIFDSLSDVVLA